MGGAVSTIDKRREQQGPGRSLIRVPPIPLNSLLAGGVILGAVGWRTWAVLQWTFLDDDWTWVWEANRMPLLHYLTQQYKGHLQPAQFATAWLVTKIAPFNYFVAILPVILMSILAGWLMWRFLGALFGERVTNLVPLAVFILCPLSVPALVWWAAALGAVPLQLFTVATLFAVLKYVRAPSTRGLGLVGLALTGGLLFSEKSLLIVPLATLFALLFLGDGRGLGRLRSLLVDRWRLWAVLAAITLVYLNWYLSAAVSQLNNAPTLANVGQLAKTTFLSGIIPTFLGGPWSAASRVGYINELGSSVRGLTWAALAGIVGASVILRKQAWRGWVLAIAYVSSSIGIVVTSNRFAILGVGIGTAARYFADSVTALALGLALAFMVPIDRMMDRSWDRRPFVERLLPQARSWALGAVRDSNVSSEGRHLWTPRRVALVVVIAYGVSALTTGSKIAAQGKDHSARAWLANVKSDLAAYPTASVVDTVMPSSALKAALLPESAKVSVALSPISSGIRWNAPSDQMFIFDDGGRLRPAQVEPGVTAPPGPIPGCGYRADANGWFVVQPGPPLFSWQWGVSFLYSTDADHEGAVTIDGEKQAVRFHKGLHTLIVIRIGTVGWVTVESKQSPVCVFSIKAGLVQPSA